MTQVKKNWLFQMMVFFYLADEVKADKMVLRQLI